MYDLSINNQTAEARRRLPQRGYGTAGEPTDTRLKIG